MCHLFLNHVPENITKTEGGVNDFFTRGIFPTIAESFRAKKDSFNNLVYSGGNQNQLRVK